MDQVRAQYEGFPYPARDPAEEAHRLIEGSPSHPVEIDHFLFGGRRDWSQPFRALVAGGGTGDGVIMLAQKLADLRCPAEVVYLDMSEASRAVAEARAAMRGLANIRFLTSDLLDAPDLGPFDYIDCCGVLHHLPDPDAGFAALAGALSPDGGMGVMVYAPYGRTGVYPLQQAFGTLFADDPPAGKLALGKAAFEALPETNWIRHNPFVGDHRGSDAGFYDLLLHSRDRAYTIEELVAALGRAGMGLVSPLEPARYDPMTYLPDAEEMRLRADALDPVARMGVAERLAGNMKTHVVYAARADRAKDAMASVPRPAAVPHLRGVSGPALAQEIARRGRVKLTVDGLGHAIELAPSSAPLIAAIDGRRSLGAIAQETGRDWLAFASGWAVIQRALTGFNLLHMSEGACR